MKTAFLLLLTSLILVSCHKEYIEKTGTFSGTEWTENDTTLTNYSLEYNKQFKQYSLKTETNNLPTISFEREDFKDNSHKIFYSSANILWNATAGTVEIILEGNELRVYYEHNDNEPNLVHFIGHK